MQKHFPGDDSGSCVPSASQTGSSLSSILHVQGPHTPSDGSPL